MKKSLFILSLIAFSIVVMASDNATQKTIVEPRIRPSDAAKVREMRMKSYGGDLIDRRGVKGTFRVVNAQNTADDKLISQAIMNIVDEIRVKATIEKGAFTISSDPVPELATLYIIDDNKYPMSLIAPEARWAVVNVAKLTCDKPKFFEARVIKEVCRASSQLFGAFSNKYESNLFSGIFKAEDLDQIVEQRMPFDYRFRFDKYIPQMGFSPFKIVHYKVACREGWAPDPTNEAQKAVWNKVHDEKERGPVNALKIVPPKK